FGKLRELRVFKCCRLIPGLSQSEQRFPSGEEIGLVQKGNRATQGGGDVVRVKLRNGMSEFGARLQFVVGEVVAHHEVVMVTAGPGRHHLDDRAAASVIDIEGVYLDG